MQDQRAACHPVHRLVEQGCREMGRGRVRDGDMWTQTTHRPILALKGSGRWSGLNLHVCWKASPPQDKGKPRAHLAQ